MRWEIECGSTWERAEMLAAAGWEPYAVTETYASWTNERKGYQESETTTTYFFRRQVAEAKE